MLRGGLVTKNIIAAFKEYVKSGGRKTTEIVTKSNVSRAIAKSDVKSGIRDRLKSKRTAAMVQRDSLKNKSGTFNRMQRNKKQKEVRELTQDINKLNTSKKINYKMSPGFDKFTDKKLKQSKYQSDLRRFNEGYGRDPRKK